MHQVFSRVLAVIYYLSDYVALKDIGEFGGVHNALILEDHYIVKVGEADSSE